MTTLQWCLITFVIGYWAGLITMLIIADILDRKWRAREMKTTKERANVRH